MRDTSSVSRASGSAIRLAWGVLLTVFMSVWAAASPGIALAQTEKAWLKQHPRIRVGIMDAWPPMNYLDQNGVPRGIGVDYAAALNKRLGGALVLVPAPFKDNCQRVLDGELDALMDITQRPDREALFTFTRPYIEISHVIVGRKSTEYFQTERDLAGKTIALERGFHNVTYFKDHFPAVRIKEYSSTSDALDAVSRGDADAYAGNRAVVVYLVEHQLLNNLRLMGKLAEPQSRLQFGVRKGQAALASILDKALASLTPAEEQAIQKKWVLGDLSALELNEAEQAWLKKHPVIRVAFDSDRAPIEFRDENDVPRGISMDYLNLLSQLLGVRFEIGHGHDWQALLDMGKRREVDAFASLMRTPERESYLMFSDVYFSLSVGVFIRQGEAYLGSVNDLDGKRVAVVQGHSPEFLLRTHHPGVHLVPAASPFEGIQMLEKGQVEAFVDYTMSTSYYLERLGLTDVHLICEIPERYEQCLGIRSDWPELVPILNKALRTIPERERAVIYSRWAQASPAPRTDHGLIWKIVAAAGAVVALSGFWNWRLGKEVAERKLATEALRQASEEQRAILEAATSGIVLAKDRTIVRCNRKLDAIFGYAPGGMIGQTTRVWYPDEETFEDVGAGISICAGKGTVFRKELQLVRRDGSLFWGRMKAQALDVATPSRGVVGVIEDVTEEREHAEALRKALEDAEAADRIKSAFLATMSHELRTPLNSIIGFTGILLQGLVGPLNDEQKKQLGMVRDSSAHLLELINDVLDISKIEAGQLEVVAEVFDLRPSLEKIVHSLRPLAEKRGIALDLRIAPEVGSLVSDRRRVEQILLNLGSNAVKFTEQGGVVISCLAREGDLEVRVEDTGIGIRPEDMDMLFMPFRQVDSGTARKYEGTGLGLSICKRLVELLGGRIWVESTVGKGSTFGFSLPRERGEM